MRFGFALIIASIGLIGAVVADETNPAPSKPPALDQPHPFSVHDMVRMQRVGDEMDPPPRRQSQP